MPNATDRIERYIISGWHVRHGSRLEIVQQMG